MPDLRPMWDIGFSLLMYVIFWGAILFGFTDVRTNRLWQGVFIAAMAFGFITALIALLVTAKSLGL